MAFPFRFTGRFGFYAKKRIRITLAFILPIEHKRLETICLNFLLAGGWRGVGNKQPPPLPTDRGTVDLGERKVNRLRAFAKSGLNAVSL
jgi:hypothetical protein